MFLSLVVFAALGSAVANADYLLGPFQVVGFGVDKEMAMKDAYDVLQQAVPILKRISERATMSSAFCLLRPGMEWRMKSLIGPSFSKASPKISSPMNSPESRSI